MHSPAAVSADAVGLNVSDVLVAVGMIVSDDTGADVTTGVCTSAHNEKIRKSGNTHNVDTYDALRLNL